jgi:catechol 2,3-dioxygenase-like lactoylglutathione lyase family enzyme
MIAHFILYVRDQARSARFYTTVLERAPTLDVPGMTEFNLGGCVLGLMPERGIQRLLREALPLFPEGESPRAELYLRVDDPAAFHARALQAGARELSRLEARDWGDAAAYSLDPDGYVLAFATPLHAG